MFYSFIYWYQKGLPIKYRIKMINIITKHTGEVNDIMTVVYDIVDVFI